jgi:hypothetical protein
MRLPHITRSARAASSDRYPKFPSDRVKYRNDAGGIDPYFDEDENEEEWKRVDLGGFPRGLDLVGVCLRLVWKDKEILAYQGASISLCVLLLIVFMSAITQGFDREYIELNVHPMIVLLQLFPYFILASFIGTYFSAATVAVATIRMKGGNPTYSDGLEVATRKSPMILCWAVVSAVVGTIIALIRSRSRGARVAADAAQLAWSVATYFVIPVMLFENKGPISAIERSTSIMKRTWRESLAGNLGMGLVFFALIIIGLLFFVPIGYALAGMIGAIINATIWIISIIVFSSAANGVLVAALYRLARTGRRPVAMDGYEYGDFGSIFDNFDRGPAEDAFLTADELTRKYAR